MFKIGLMKLIYDKVIKDSLISWINIILLVTALSIRGIDTTLGSKFITISKGKGNNFSNNECVSILRSSSVIAKP